MLSIKKFANKKNDFFKPKNLEVRKEEQKRKEEEKERLREERSLFIRNGINKILATKNLDKLSDFEKYFILKFKQNFTDCNFVDVRHNGNIDDYIYVNLDYLFSLNAYTTYFKIYDYQLRTFELDFFISFIKKSGSKKYNEQFANYIIEKYFYNKENIKFPIMIVTEKTETEFTFEKDNYIIIITTISGSIIKASLIKTRGFSGDVPKTMELDEIELKSLKELLDEIDLDNLSNYKNNKNEI